MYRGLTVGVVVPAYNEEGSVGRVVDTLPSIVDRAYVVDDGSTDDTWAEIRRHAAARNGDHDDDGGDGHHGDGHDHHGDGHDHHDDGDDDFDDVVVPIRHERNRGVGGAIKTGYLRAREEGIDVTAVLGGDGQMDPGQLPRYLDPIVEGEAGYVKGNRFLRPADWADMPRFRLVGNVLLSYLTKVASGYWGTADSQNGYTAISLDALRAVDVEGMYEYYGYCNDLLVRCNLADVTVAEVPRSSTYAYDDGWDSHISYSEYVPRVSAMLARGFLRRLWRKHLLTDYHPLAPLYLLGAAASATGLLGLLASLLGRSRDGPGTWLPGVLAGAVTFLYATHLDGEENRRLEAGVFDPAGETGGPSAEAADPVRGTSKSPEDETEPPEEAIEPPGEATDPADATGEEGRSDAADAPVGGED